MRLFLAINLPADVRSEITAATAALRDCAPELGWVREAKLHLTLKFLGEQPPERAGEIQAAIASVAGRHRELNMELGGIGAFPNFRRPRVVWLGVGQDPRLELLHHDVETAGERIGFEVDGRPFRPHLTLGRVIHALPAEQLRGFVREGKRTDYTADVVVQSIDLMRSERSSAGSTYTTLFSAALRSD
ncbi:MAG TPA: RNA 2',3'-cyclic phosphodiesterase [Gemmatimonadaceae bacterium]|nr:RNA 2',3'-cyclic phosphodiesterase [Gemmatimonadaceae bacterium]